MAADSRWTYEKGVDFDDGAVKVAALSPYSLGIYAGDVVVGTRALGRVTEELGRLALANPQQLLRLARAAFQSAWRSHKRRDSRAEFCIGMYHRQAGFHLWHFRDQDGFRPHEIDGIQTIGSPDSKVMFWEKLRTDVDSRVAAPLTEVVFSNSVEEWGSYIGRAVWETCRSRIDSYTGGPFLLAFLDRAGVHGRSLHRADPRAATLEFQQITLRPDETAAFQERQRTRGKHGG